MEVDDPVEDFDLFDTFDMLSSGPTFNWANSHFHVLISFMKYRIDLNVGRPQL